MGQITVLFKLCSEFSFYLDVNCILSCSESVAYLDVLPLLVVSVLNSREHREQGVTKT